MFEYPTPTHPDVTSKCRESSRKRQTRPKHFPDGMARPTAKLQTDSSNLGRKLGTFLADGASIYEYGIVGNLSDASAAFITGLGLMAPLEREIQDNSLCRV